MFVLEQLSDEDIAQIITRAVRRVSPTTVEREAPHYTTEAPPSVLLNSSPPPPSEDEHKQPATTSKLQFPGLPQLTGKILSSIISLSSGDARTALSLLELVLSAPPTFHHDKLLASLRQSVSTSYDRTGDSRYDMISALHKSVRGSQGSAALYWLARMLTTGEDPLYIARRMIVCASEDIGLADNQALPLVCIAYTIAQSQSPSMKFRR